MELLYEISCATQIHNRPERNVLRVPADQNLDFAVQKAAALTQSNPILL